jgi:hypothetical protein
MRIEKSADGEMTPKDCMEIDAIIAGIRREHPFLEDLDHVAQYMLATSIVQQKLDRLDSGGLDSMN